MSARYDICQCGALDHLDKHGLCLECQTAAADAEAQAADARRDAQLEAGAILADWNADHGMGEVA